MWPGYAASTSSGEPTPMPERVRAAWSRYADTPRHDAVQRVGGRPGRERVDLQHELVVQPDRRCEVAAAVEGVELADPESDTRPAQLHDKRRPLARHRYAPYELRARRATRDPRALPATGVGTFATRKARGAPALRCGRRCVVQLRSLAVIAVSSCTTAGGARRSTRATVGDEQFTMQVDGADARAAPGAAPPGTVPLSVGSGARLRCG